MTDILNAAPAELEQAAHVLEQSGDYRVLRRLVPRDDFGTRPDGPLLKALVVDVETTGTDTEHDHIIELGMVCFEYSPDTGEVAWVSDVYDSFEDPGVPIPPESTAIHGITREMVAGHRLDDDAVAELLEDAQWVVAHNAAFDRPLLERRLPVFAGKRWLCSYAELPWAKLGFSSGKLEFLANARGFFYEGHRSEIDCRALLEVLRLPLPQTADNPWQRLLASGVQQSYRIWAIDAPFDSKEALKARGYRWDGQRRCWHRTMSHDEAAAEAPWLKERVYGGRSREVELEVHDALTRYSQRPGRKILRPL